MKPIILNLVLCAFLYSVGFQAYVTAQQQAQTGPYVPSPQYGYGSPSPAYRYGSPSPAYGYGSPSPAYGYGSPSPAYGYGSPSPAYGYGSPSPAYGYDSPSPTYGEVSPPPAAYPGGYTPGSGSYPGGHGNGPYGPGGSKGPYGPGGNNGPYGPGGNYGPYGPGGNGNGPYGPGGINSPPGGVYSPPMPPTPGCPKAPAGPRVDPIGWEQFSNAPSTKYNFTDGQCARQCDRRSVQQWTPEDWCLYSQLFNEANRRGYIGDFLAIHELDNQVINGQRVKFHNVQAFFPWHRFFLHHFEQILQKVDHELNPGKAVERGEFCLGYWDWRKSDDLLNSYGYLFNESALGSLKPERANIPDGAFKDLAVSIKGSLQDVTRAPGSPNDRWDLNLQDTCDKQEFGDNNLDGMHGCWERIHGSVHVQVGGTMELPETSPADPIFYLHHTMVDYVWARWQKTHDKYPSTFSQAQPLPYQQWTLNDAIDVHKFCFSYGDLEIRKAKIAKDETVSADYNSLDETYKPLVEQILQKGRPGTPSREEFERQNSFTVAMATSSEEVGQLYDIYVENIKVAQDKYDLFASTFGASFAQSNAAQAVAPDAKSFPLASPPPAIGNVGRARKVAGSEVTDILQNLATN